MTHNDGLSIHLRAKRLFKSDSLVETQREKFIVEYLAS